MMTPVTAILAALDSTRWWRRRCAWSGSVAGADPDPGNHGPVRAAALSGSHRYHGAFEWYVGARIVCRGATATAVGYCTIDPDPPQSPDVIQSNSKEFS